MKRFRVATINTPEVLFDLQEGFIGITGISTTFNSADFYKSFIDDLKEYRDVEGDIEMNICLEHFNTSSAKSLYDILIELKKRQLKGNGVTVNWLYDQYNTEMEEMGNDISELTDLDFQLLPHGEVIY